MDEQTRNDVGSDAMGDARRSDPRILLSKIEGFTTEVGQMFKGILGSLEGLQSDIRQLDHLKDVVMAAEGMLTGKHRNHISLEAQGEVGKLVSAINRTLVNLQQLDKTVHRETGKVPELASHLDHIINETETATQQVLEKLDLMIEGSERQNNALQELKTLSRRRLELDQEAKQSVERFLENLSKGEDQASVLQEAMDFVALMGQQARVHLAKSEEVDQAIDQAAEQAEILTNHAFDIMNVLQFQDITRQKVSKIIGLLKDMQTGLFRLLDIFNIRPDDSNRLDLEEKHKATQERILERDAIATDAHVESVEDIIKNFQNK